MTSNYCFSFLPLLLMLITVTMLFIALPCQAQDDSEMILIPAGPFTMGSPGSAIDEDVAERPVHEVTLPDFYIDRCEITNAQYANFLNAISTLKDDTGHNFVWLAPYFGLEQIGGNWQPKSGRENYPVTCITWYGAMAYAKWAGKRLPTEAEWEKAARGTDGRKFPWGNEMDFGKFTLGAMKINPVGLRPEGASPYGCLNMADNVWEWTSTLFMPYPYVAIDGREDPASAGRRVARGGSWEGEPFIAHSACRFRPEPQFAHLYLGFRCAK